jgi:beta-lactamase regulating signal transducer with metallopeptidase domain
MEIGLIDILLVVFPFYITNILLILFSTSNFPIRAKIPIIMTSYTLLITTVIFSILFIFHLHLEGSIAVHIHEFHSPTIVSIFLLRLDLLGITIILWGGSVIISALILSQIAMFMLNNHYNNISISNRNLMEISKGEFSQTTQNLINKYNIEFIILKEEYPFLFTFSYYKFLKKKNVILVSSKILKLLDNEELEIGVLHEIGHIEYHDTIINPIFNAITKIMFFDPFLKRIKKKYQEKIEVRADNFVIKNHNNSRLLGSILLKINKFIVNMQSKEKKAYDKMTEYTSKTLLENRLKNIKEINIS